MGSSRLPGKALLPLDDRCILGHVVSRCEDASTPGKIVVTTGNRSHNDAITEWCRRTSIHSLTGPEEDLLSRHCQVLSTTDSDILIRITGDCPFVPPSEIDRVITEHRSRDVALTTNNTPAMPTGTAVDVIERDALEAIAAGDADHPIAPITTADSNWDVHTTDSEQWRAVGDGYTAVDTPNDYWCLSDAVEAVGTDPYAVTEWTAGHTHR
jgi:spore coat polysaccharide biosynthesis protein SpsF